MKIFEEEGFLFVTSGCEHGPTLMKWQGDWDEEKFEKILSKSWCDNEFRQKDAQTIDFDFLIPGKKYRITIEEIFNDG